VKGEKTKAEEQSRPEQKDGSRVKGRIVETESARARENVKHKKAQQEERKKLEQKSSEENSERAERT
jgi:hypothetical protein